MTELKYREILLMCKFATDLVSLDLILFVKIINRYRSVRFSETKTRFELPRILATSDIALRLLHTHYDHVTPPFPVRALLREPTSTESHFAEGEVNVVETVIPEDFEEEHKQQENESISVHEEEIKVEEQVDTKVRMVGHFECLHFFIM